MKVVQNKVVHVKVKSDDIRGEWHSFYKGDIVPDRLVDAFLVQGGVFDNVKEEESVEVGEDVKEEKKDKPRNERKSKEQEPAKELKEPVDGLELDLPKKKSTLSQIKSDVEKDE